MIIWSQDLVQNEFSPLNINEELVPMDRLRLVFRALQIQICTASELRIRAA